MLHLVGCNLELYYDARTYEYQISELSSLHPLPEIIGHVNVMPCLFVSLLSKPLELDINLSHNFLENPS
jgi:hypothetical protein